ncbi:hypothetical protein [Roseibium sp.]|uniref:hypothetical protein n=1 Tax=Roseibium sp. TaxID=1936156 RepID=UPI003A97C1B4
MKRPSVSDHRRSMVLASRAMREREKRGLPPSYDALERDVEARGREPAIDMAPGLEAVTSMEPVATAGEERGLDPAEIPRLLLETPQAERAAMIGRLYRAFEAQVESMEVRLKDLTAEAGASSLADIDRTAKTLASLARTLTLLLDLKTEAEAQAAETGSDTGSEDDDHQQLSADELRKALAERLGRLCPP